MSFYAQDPGGIYANCGCEKPPEMRWDPHPDCLFHVYAAHYEEVKYDLDHDGEPSCRYCATIWRPQRAHWSERFKALRIDVTPASYTGSASQANTTVANQLAPTVPMASEDDFLQPSGVMSHQSGKLSLFT